jgi:colanic acid/amylovoran biosynthesis glycosyltransferase
MATEVRSRTDRPHQVTIWLHEILGLSETFIANQTNALRGFQPRFAATRAIENPYGIVPDVVSSSVNDPQLIDLIQSSDVVHAHFGPDATWILPAVRKTNTPLLVTFHGYDATVRHIWWDPRNRAKLRALFREATVIIAVSDYIAGRLRKLGAPNHKIVTHYIGIPLAEDVQDSGDREGLLHVGRLVSKKGCADLLRAMARLPEPLRSTPLVVAGDGPLRGQLEALAQRFNLNVRFLGAVDHEMVGTLMRQATLLCAPSKRALNGDAEGLPTTILEAASLRLPVVSTYSAGIPEAITDRESGLLVPESSPSDLSEAIAEMLTDSSLRSRIADAARRTVQTSFDVVNQTAKLEQIYESAMRSSDAREV